MAYEKQNFAAGNALTAAQLNHIEDGIVTLEAEIASKQVTISGTVTKALGGIAKDTVYDNTDITEVLSDLLFPYVAFTFSSIRTSQTSGTLEYGTTRTISSVTPTFTRGSKNITSVSIGTTSGGSDLYSGTNATSGTAITLTANKTYNGTTGGTIYCTLSDGDTSISRSATVNYAYFNYVTVTSSTSIPTSKGDNGKNLGLSYEDSEITTTDGTYIWFLMPDQDRQYIQQYAMSQWNYTNTTYAGTVTFTTDTGRTTTYYAYRTDELNADIGHYRITVNKEDQ